MAILPDVAPLLTETLLAASASPCGATSSVTSCENPSLLCVICTLASPSPAAVVVDVCLPFLISRVWVPPFASTAAMLMLS